jgi:hypothetical protein
VLLMAKNMTILTTVGQLMMDHLTMLMNMLKLTIVLQMMADYPSMLFIVRNMLTWMVIVFEFELLMKVMH